MSQTQLLSYEYSIIRGAKWHMGRLDDEKIANKVEGTVADSFMESLYGSRRKLADIAFH